MKKGDAYPPRFFAAATFGPKPRVFVIECVRKEPFENDGKKTEKPVMYAKGERSGYKKYCDVTFRFIRLRRDAQVPPDAQRLRNCCARSLAQTRCTAAGQHGPRWRNNLFALCNRRC